MGHSKTTRRSSIELLRIVACIFVIILHYFNYNIGKGMSFVFEEGDFYDVLALHVFESLAFCAVDLFIMISGYFLCMTEKRNISKVVFLFFQASVLSCGYYLITCLLGYDMFSAVGLLKSLLSYGYFIVLYSVTYIVSPLINMALNKQGTKVFQKTVVILFVLFSVLTSMVDFLDSKSVLGISWSKMSTVSFSGSIEGYSITNFLLCYIIGAFIRKAGEKMDSRRKQIILLFVCFAGINVWSFIDWKSAYTYNNPLVLFEAALFLILFKDWNFQSSIVNRFSKAVFTVYLVHVYFIPLLFIQFHVKKGWPVFSIHVIVSAIVIYLISYCVYVVYQLIFSRFINSLSEKIDSAIELHYVEEESC